jgi:hypothetical protein
VTLLPSGNVTDGLSESSKTARPPAGAFPERVTVPVARRRF